MKHKIKEIFFLSDNSTLIIITDNRQLPQSLCGKWGIWKDHIFYNTLSVIAENIPVPRLTKDRILQTKTLLNKADLNTAQNILELVFLG